MYSTIYLMYTYIVNTLAVDTEKSRVLETTLSILFVHMNEGAAVTAYFLLFQSLYEDRLHHTPEAGGGEHY